MVFGRLGRHIAILLIAEFLTFQLYILTIIDVVVVVVNDAVIINI